MASSEVKAKPESDVTPVGEDTLDFDDDTLKGKKSRHLLVRLNVVKTFSPRMIANGKWNTLVFRFLEPSVSRTYRYLEPKLVFF